MLAELEVRSRQRTEFVDITDQVARLAAGSGARDGVAVVYTPHTTAAVTINENADPSVMADMAHALDKIAPWSDPTYTHSEGNSAAHVKSSLVGCSVMVPFAGGRLSLGTWQGIFFCEFDGPRSRKVLVQIIGGGL